ncbi:MFS transporter [Marinobacterium rhizophilum]|uniref:MFS transporter n=1 Tax=Marinobacterium rhizophilum TaxID=420402 RepID=A0ABY5HGY8_9GAMM|nr:MFS transporter [Marinobacterium rhizophilum]UTW10562.1 MFS transporter [Marinobacterium rhizophilum]
MVFQRRIESQSSSRSAFSSRVFCLYFGGSAFLTLATWITRFLIGWSTWDLTQSPLWVGAVSAAMLLPTFFLSPVFGVLADRLDPRQGMLVAYLSEAFISVSAAVANYQGQFSLHWILALAFLLGVVSAAQHPMRLVLLPHLVARPALPSAVGLASITYNLSRIVGPALGAWLLVSMSTGAAFLLVAVLFGIGSLFLLRIRVRVPRAAHHVESIFVAMSQGLRVIRNSPLIRLVLILTMVDGMIGRSIMELLPAISGRLIQGDASTLASLSALAGIGSVLGGVIVSRMRGRERSLLQLVFGSLLLCSVVVLPVVWVHDRAGLGAMIMLVSMAVTMIGTGCQALIQVCVADAYRGRVLSIWTVVSLGVPALGAFLMGSLAEMVGFVAVLIACALATAALVVVLWQRCHVATVLKNVAA